MLMERGKEGCVGGGEGQLEHWQLLKQEGSLMVSCPLLAPSSCNLQLGASKFPDAGGKDVGVGCCRICG